MEHARPQSRGGCSVTQEPSATPTPTPLPPAESGGPKCGRGGAGTPAAKPTPGPSAPGGPPAPGSACPRSEVSRLVAEVSRPQGLEELTVASCDEWRRAEGSPRGHGARRGHVRQLTPPHPRSPLPQHSRERTAGVWDSVGRTRGQNAAPHGRPQGRAEERQPRQPREEGRARRRRLCSAAATPGGPDQAPPHPVARKEEAQSQGRSAPRGSRRGCDPRAERRPPQPPRAHPAPAQDLRTPAGLRSPPPSQRRPAFCQRRSCCGPATKVPETSGTCRASRLCEGGAFGAAGLQESRASESACARACERRAPWELGAPAETASGSRALQLWDARLWCGGSSRPAASAVP